MSETTKRIALALVCASFAVYAAADIIYLRGTGEKKGTAMRGAIAPTDDNQMKITREDGTTLIVPESRVISVVKDADTLPPARFLAKKATPKAKAIEKPATSKAETVKEGAEKGDTAKDESGDNGKLVERDPEVVVPGAKENSDANDTRNVAAKERVSGYFTISKGSKWVKTTGDSEYTERVTDVETTGKKTTYSVIREYADKKTSAKYWRIIVEDVDGKKTYSRKDGLAEPFVIFMEPCALGSEWKGKDGETWRVTSLQEAYTDRSGTTHQNCVRVDRISRKGVVEDGQQAIYAPGVGRVNSGFKSYKAGE